MFDTGQVEPDAAVSSWGAVGAPPAQGQVLLSGLGAGTAASAALILSV